MVSGICWHAIYLGFLIGESERKSAIITRISLSCCKILFIFHEKLGGGNPFQSIDKTSVLQETRMFNDTPVNVRKCTHILTKILYLINQVCVHSFYFCLCLN